MKEENTLLIRGDCSPELIEHVNKHFATHWPNLNAKLSADSKSGNVIFGQEAIELASALASILGFAITIWNMRIKNQILDKFKVRESFNMEIKRTESKGYRLDDLRIEKNDMRLKVTDIPGKCTLAIQLKAARNISNVKVFIRQSPYQAHQKEEK